MLDTTYLRILQHFLRQETLAENKVCVGQISQALQQDLHHHLQVAVGGVELVQLQQSKVGLEIVSLLPSLEINIVFQSLDVLRVVSLNTLEHGLDL